MFSRLFPVLTLSRSTQSSTIFVNALRLNSTATPTKKSAVKDRTPLGKLDEGAHPDAQKQPLKQWPNNTNPYTGEVNGPSGPEPTRYGDWERKGKCVDF